MIPSRQARKVVLLCGGPSAEYVVSLTSARYAAHALDRHRYRLRVACVEDDGSWIFPLEEFTAETPPSRVEKLFDLLDMPELCPKGYLTRRTPMDALANMMAWGVDVVVPVMHGSFGEDGRLQGLLDFLGIPYVGSGVLASALSMDKKRTKDFLAANGIRVASHVLLNKMTLPEHREDQLTAAASLLGFPLVVKPNRGGSSIASGIARTPEELRSLVMRAFDADMEVLVEQFVAGQEVTCGVLDLAECFGGRVVCPPTLIRPKCSKFFDFDAKYRPGATEEITPAPLPSEIINRIHAVAEKCHDLLGCRSMSRTDLIVPEDGQPVYLETNTLPGMTGTSLLPQGAAAAGIAMTTLLTGLIEGTLEHAVEARLRRRTI